MERLILTIQTGKARRIECGEGVEVFSAIDKQPVCDKIWVGTEGLFGDEVGNQKYHGGPDKAICCFACEHYPRVEELLGRAVPFGAFGENFTLRGLTEPDVFIGDIYKAGDALVEVAQPRQPCPVVAQRWQCEALPKWMVDEGVTGWYMRVLNEGMVERGTRLKLVRQAEPRVSVATLNRLFYQQEKSPDTVKMALSVDALADRYSEELSERTGVLLDKRATI